MAASVDRSIARLSASTKGVFVISATPFRDDGSLDLPSTDALVDFYLERGVHGITILGMMGEAPKLSTEESRTFVARVLDRIGGRIPVVVGVSHASTDRLVELARGSMDQGAAGVMVAPIPGLKHEEAVLSYFESTCAALGDDVPVCYQDYPQTTGVPISVATFLRIVDRLPQVVMLKHEDCPGLRKLTGIRQRSEAQGLRRVSILCGNGGLYLPQELARGADGAMTGFAYPEMLVQVVEAYAAGDGERGEDIFDAYLPLVRYEQQPGFGLAVRKEVLRRRGAIATSRVRTPGPHLDADDLRELDRLITRVERRLEA